MIPYYFAKILTELPHARHVDDALGHENLHAIAEARTPHELVCVVAAEAVLVCARARACAGVRARVRASRIGWWEMSRRVACFVRRVNRVKSSRLAAVAPSRLDRPVQQLPRIPLGHRSPAAHERD